MNIANDLMLMKGFITNIEKETVDNHDYRRVLYTSKGLQLVVMNLAPGVEIGEEVHDLDQFIRVESGSGKVILNDIAHDIRDDDAVIIPRGVKHNVLNNGSAPLKLYSLYGPPEHKDGIVQPTKDDETEEHFDGTTTE